MTRTDPPDGPVARGPRWVFHPVCVALAFVLYVGLRNEVAPAGLARPLLVAVAASVLLIGVGWLVLRNRWDGALAALIVVTATVSLYPLLTVWQVLVDALGFAMAVVVVAIVLFVVVAAPAVLALRAIRGARPVPRPSAATLNVLAAIVLVVVVATNGGPYVANVVLLDVEAAPIPTVEADAPPDIYLVILDGYPRSDVLRDRFGLDNQAFLDGLRDRGFSVDDGSLSNYVFTPLTFLSLLDMRHLADVEAVAPLIGIGGPHHGTLRGAINASRAFGILHAAGYEVVVSSNGHEHVALRDAADRLVNDGELSDIELGLLERTWLVDAMGLVAPNFLIDRERDRVVQQFRDLEGLAVEQRDGPMFALVHIPSPHLPLALNADGSSLALGSRNLYAQTPEQMEVTPEEFLTALAGELQYIDARVLDAVDRIQSGSAREAVIILMSDHGMNYQLESVPGIRFRNLLAAFTPGAHGLLDGATPVNLLARVFNEYLGTNLEHAPDRFFDSPTNSGLMLLLTEMPDPDASPAIAP